MQTSLATIQEREALRTSGGESSASLARILIALVALLTCFGLIAIYAASSLKGAQQFHDEFFFLRKQLIAAVVGFSLLAGIQKLPFDWVEHATLPIIGFTTFLLALIFIPGMYSKVGGAQRWLNLPFIGGQPAELVKLAMVMFLAKNLSRRTSDMQSFARGVLPNFIIFGLFSGLLFFQKDLGTPVLMFAVTFLMLFVAGVAAKFVIAVLATGLMAAGLAVIIEPYRVARIMSFLDPWSQMQGSGFQIIQSFLAFQNGGLLGVGLGESKQKLFFLPEAHTDFILSVIGEELGLVGVGFLCLLFVSICLTGLRIAKHQSEPYRKFLAFGLTMTISLEAILNMGVTMGLLPTKGMPLPFVSSGNSSLLVFLVMAGILARLAKDIRPPSPQAQELRRHVASS